MTDDTKPHVHEPAGPGEYCTGCFDQGAVWARHEERARIKRIVEDALECDDPDDPCDPHADPCCGPCNWRPAILAAIEGASDDYYD